VRRQEPHARRGRALGSAGVRHPMPWRGARGSTRSQGCGVAQRRPVAGGARRGRPGLLDRYLLRPLQPTDLRPVVHRQHLAPSPLGSSQVPGRGQISPPVTKGSVFTRRIHHRHRPPRAGAGGGGQPWGCRWGDHEDVEVLSPASHPSGSWSIER
jgi:hypothetical protein